MTEKGIQMIKEFEGFRSKAYKCPAGIWTIGYGATFYMDGSKVREGDTITMEDATELLNFMCEKTFGEFVDKNVKVKINQNQRDALISFAYNCGNANLGKSTLLKKVNANPSDETIRNEFMKWNKAAGKELAGLTRRRKGEADLYFTEWIEPVTEPVVEEPTYNKTLTGHLKSEGLKEDNIIK